MKKLNTLLLLTLIVAFAGCKSNQKITDIETGAMTHNSENSLDWDGYYVGTLPCADCPGITTELELRKDLTFVLKETYMDRDISPRFSMGAFSWSKQGSTITLNSNNKPSTSYLVGENTLFQLDMKGNRFIGALADRFELQKKQLKITDTRWKLVELHGQKVDNSQAFVVFSTEKDRVYGNSGCNNFTGGFVLKEGDRLTLSQIASTRMACPDMDTEQAFLSVLEMTDNYTISGGTLSLNKARMAPLARFEAEFTEE